MFCSGTGVGGRLKVKKIRGRIPPVKSSGKASLGSRKSPAVEAIFAARLQPSKAAQRGYSCRAVSGSVSVTFVYYV